MEVTILANYYKPTEEQREALRLQKSFLPEIKLKHSIANEECFKGFTRRRKLAPRTIELYISYLNRFCNYWHLTLEEMLDIAENEEDDRVRMRRRSVNKWINEYNEYIEKAKYSFNTIKHIMMCIRTFFRHYTIQLPDYEKITSRASKSVNNNLSVESIPTKEEIQRLYDVCNPIYRVFILIGMSSGMGRAEICSLTYDHFFKAFDIEPTNNLDKIVTELQDKKDYIATWNITRIKTGNKYFTFTSPEVNQALALYMNTLSIKHLDYKPKPKDKLIRSLTNCNALKPKLISKQFYYHNKNNQYRKHDDRYVVTPHGFRRFFASTLEMNKIPHLITRRLMGHSFDNTTGAYFKISPEVAKEEYIEVLPDLILSNSKIINLYKYQDLYDELNNLKKITLKDKIDPSILD